MHKACEDDVLKSRGELSLSSNESTGRRAPVRDQQSKGTVILLNVEVPTQMITTKNTNIPQHLHMSRIFENLVDPMLPPLETIGRIR